MLGDARPTNVSVPVTLALLLAGACVIPPPAIIVYPGQKYRGNCECTFCVEEDATGTCIDPRESDGDVQTCGRNLDLLTDPDRQAIFERLTTECSDASEFIDEFFDQVECSLAVLRPSASGVEQFFEPVFTEENECPSETQDLDLFLVRFPTPPITSQVAAFNSSVRITDPDFTATIEVRGTVEFSGGNCFAASCPIVIHRMRLTSDQFDVDTGGDTITARDAALVNRTEGTGTCFSLAPLNGCGFLLDELSLEIVATAFDEDGSLRALTLANEKAGGGIIAFGDHSIVVTDTFTTGDTVAEFNLHGTVANFSPHVSITAPLSVDCGFGVQIPAIIEDVDHGADQLDVVWYVDGEFAARGGAPLITDLEPGSHTISIAAFDPAGGIGVDSAVVEVAEDVTPPQIIVGAALCLWPPNHQQVVLTGSDAGVIAVDDCDPDPEVVFVSGASSQPDDASGDGATTSDLVVLPESICVRRERQGGDRDGRTYTIRVVAVDAAGNTSEEAEATVAVNHDQSSQCTVSGGIAVDDDDPRCIPPPVDSSRSGCRASADGVGGLIAAAMLLLLALLRRPKESDGS